MSAVICKRELWHRHKGNDVKVGDEFEVGFIFRDFFEPVVCVHVLVVAAAWCSYLNGGRLVADYPELEQMERQARLIIDEKKQKLSDGVEP